MSNEEYLIELIAGVLNDKNIAEPADNIDFSEVFKFACRHNVHSIAFIGLGRIKAKPDEEVYRQWKEKYSKDIVRSIKQMNELSELSRLFSENEIVHLPLKGCVLKKMYAASELRFMSDLDILIDVKDKKKVKELLEGCGYTCELYGKGNHDVYRKAPIYNVEIHRNLFIDELVTKAEYYSNFLQRTHAGENEYARVMSDEDFYVHNIAHFHKHFDFGGSGIRSVMDVYVMRRAFWESIDIQYVEAELSKLGLAEFEKSVARLGDCWFGNGAHDDEIDKVAAYIIGSGTYGNVCNVVNNQIDTFGKWKWFWRTVFLPYEYMKDTFPVLKKVPVLLPIFWVWRIITTVIKKPKMVINKAKIFMKRMLFD